MYEHYLPRFAGDALPQAPAGRMVSIADKLDNIVATFSRGLIPTGSQDPYALRRQALGIVNILIDARYHISLRELAVAAMDLLAIAGEERRAKLTEDIGEFFRLRLKNVLADEGIRYDMVDAILATATDDVYDAWLRAKALAEVGATEAMRRAVEGLTRAGNLAKNATSDAIAPALFATEGEKTLYAALDSARREIAAKSASRDYAGVLKTMAGLAGPIDAFFVQVMVMVDDIAVRENRLALLKAITSLTKGIADLTKIVAA